MYARMTTTVMAEGEEVSPAEVLAQILPTIRRLDGYRGMLIISEQEGERIVAISLWDSAQALEASEATMGKIRAAETSARNVESQESSKFQVAALDLNT
jgi:heme-degrading monooxygenase HmoA